MSIATQTLTQRMGPGPFSAFAFASPWNSDVDTNADVKCEQSINGSVCHVNKWNFGTWKEGLCCNFVLINKNVWIDRLQNIPFLIHSVCTYVLTFVLAHNTTPGKSIFMLQHKKYLLILVFYLRNAGSCICLFLFVFKYSVQIESYKRFCMKNLTLFTVNGKYTDCTFFKRMNYTN